MSDAPQEWDRDRRRHDPQIKELRDDVRAILSGMGEFKNHLNKLESQLEAKFELVKRLGAENDDHERRLRKLEETQAKCRVEKIEDRVFELEKNKETNKGKGLVLERIINWVLVIASTVMAAWIITHLKRG